MMAWRLWNDEQYLANQCDCCKEIWNKDSLKSVTIGEHKMAFCPDCFTEYQKTKPDTKSIVNEIRELAKFHSVEVPMVYGDGTPVMDKMISLTKLGYILSEMETAVKEGPEEDTIIEEDTPAVLDRIIGEIRGYQGKLNPDLDHDDLIESNAYENVIDIIETHKYLDFEPDKSYERDR